MRHRDVSNSLCRPTSSLAIVFLGVRVIRAPDKIKTFFLYFFFFFFFFSVVGRVLFMREMRPTIAAGQRLGFAALLHR